MGRTLFAAVASVLLVPSLFAQEVCATCHSKIAESYRRTGMARSFYKPTSEFVTAKAYYHQPSDTYFAMIQRGGQLFQRQHQIGFDRKETNVLEKRVDFVLGSGNH